MKYFSAIPDGLFEQIVKKYTKGQSIHSGHATRATSADKKETSVKSSGMNHNDMNHGEMDHSQMQGAK
ncbi:hypothetical protein D3C71_1918110 [compost metagenome]